jgi:thiol-disulfide isomerase/thioredoxin
MKTAFIFLIMLLACTNSFSKNVTVLLSLDNANIFDKIFVNLTTDNGDYKFDGKKNKNNYFFSIPDSIIQTYYGINFHANTTTDSIYADLGFATVSEQDTSLYVSGTLYWTDSDTLFLSGNFFAKSTDIYPSLRNRKITTYKYIVTSSDPEVKTSIKAACSRFGRFYDPKEESNYESILQYYINEIKKHPDSKSLMYGIYSGLRYYQSVSDLKMVYDSFSEKNKQSYYGKKIKEYCTLFDSPFSNMQLTNSLTNEQELIVLSKPTIVIFSASWCKPCHKLVPILKKIYDKVSSKIDMVYISIDQNETESNWIDFLKNENIPWRSLSAKDKMKEVMSKYSISTIPVVFYICNSKVERLFLTEEKDICKIYDYYNNLH